MESNKFKINRAPLEDLEIELTKPVTFIYADNGVGKTTISRFFKDYNTKSNIDSIPIEVFNADLMSTYFHFKNQNPESENQINSVLEFTIEDNEDITAIKTQMQEKEDGLKDKYKQIKSYKKEFSSSNNSLSKLYQDISCDDDKIKKKEEELENIYRKIHDKYTCYKIKGYINYDKNKIIKHKNLNLTPEILQEKDNYKNQLDTYSKKQNLDKIEIKLECNLFNEPNNSEDILKICHTKYNLEDAPFLEDYKRFVSEGMQKIDPVKISKNEKCIFCNQKLSEEAVNHIKSYFSYFRNTSNTDREILEKYIQNIEVLKLCQGCKIERVEDQSKGTTLDVKENIGQYKTDKEQYQKELQNLIEEINKKISNMSLEISIESFIGKITNLKSSICKIIQEINEKINIYNQNLDSNRRDIEQVLEKFIAILLHENEGKINILERDIKTLQDEFLKEKDTLQNLEDGYLELEKKLPNKQKYSKAVDTMNGYLSEIWHGNKKIKINLNDDFSHYEVNLLEKDTQIENPIFSESEKNSIVLAYFFTKLENFLITHKEKANIVVIDDPLNSFDDKICSNLYEIFASIMFKKNNNGRYHKIKDDYKETKFLLLTHNYKFLYCFKNVLSPLINQMSYWELEKNINGGRQIKVAEFNKIPIFGVEYLLQIAKVFHELYIEEKTKDFSKNYRQFIELLSNLIDDENNDKYTNILSKHRYNAEYHSAEEITVENLGNLFKNIKEFNESIWNNIKKCAEDVYNDKKPIEINI